MTVTTPQQTIPYLGRSKWELDTPTLLLDLDVLERNIAKIAGRIHATGVHWRPHVKSQKIPALAHMQLAAGAIGVTCAKLGEAEVMASSGIRDILIANQIVGREKIARLVNLRKHADVMIAFDDLDNAREVSAAAEAKGVRIRAVVEVNVGMNRCGVEPGEPTLRLAEQLHRLPGLQFAGVMAWESHATTIRDPSEKRAVIFRDVGRLVATAEQCSAAGLPVQVVSCGGTGTYWITCQVPGVTEIQAGGGIFHDVRYETEYGVDHEFALTVMTTVISRPTPTRIIVDAGLKTMSSQQAPPRPIGIEGVKELKLSAEHGKIELGMPNNSLRVGDKLEFIAGYAETTTMLHEEIYATRGNIVEQVWPVLARGKLR